MTFVALCEYTFINAFMGRIWSFYRYENHKSGQILHTWPLTSLFLLSLYVRRRQTYWRRRRRSWKQRSPSCRKRRSAWSLSWWPTSRTVRSRTRSRLTRALRSSSRCSPSSLPSPYKPCPMWACLWRRTLTFCLPPTLPTRLPHSPSLRFSSKSSRSLSQG